MEKQYFLRDAMNNESLIFVMLANSETFTAKVCCVGDNLIRFKEIYGFAKNLKNLVVSLCDIIAIGEVSVDSTPNVDDIYEIYK